MGQRVEQLSTVLERGSSLRQQLLDRAFAALRKRCHTLAYPDDSRTMRVGIGAQAHREPCRCIAQSLRASRLRDAVRPPPAFHQGRQDFATARDPRAQHVRAKPPRNARELRVMTLRIGNQRARKAGTGTVEALARESKQLLDAGQSASCSTPTASACAPAALPTGERAARQSGKTQRSSARTGTRRSRPRHSASARAGRRQSR